MSRLNFQHILKALCLLIAYLGFIFFLSSLQLNPEKNLLPKMDKVIHFFLYIPVPIVFFFLMRQFPSDFTKCNFWALGIILSLLFAASDEWHQSFVPTRSMDLHDWLADGAGILVGVALFWLLLKWKSNYERS